MLNNPYDKRVGHLDGYHRMMVDNHTMSNGFTNSDTMELLCITGRSYNTNCDGQPKRIYRKHMTTMAQIWMIFLLHNIISNTHVSSLLMHDCYLIYSILEELDIDVVQVMANEIYKTVAKGGKKGTIGFPSLITSLCARQGV
ncbi:hypothetical protein Lal_00035269 [Lupinus albus]|nr:hypothetical protein Lal_00035269 [Lupinus albus]